MLPVFKAFYDDLDGATLKFVRPRKFVFLCGGILEEGTTSFRSVRDFFVKQSLLEKEKIDYVLAESANKLYESTKYKDLISFEEDVARIAAVILVITESPGSLAELGAFASYDPLKSNLRLIVDARHEGDKSFIREGPIRRLQQKNSKHVGFFDWSNGADGHVLPEIAKHEAGMSAFVSKHVKSISITQICDENPGLKPFYILLWIIYVAQVISYDLLMKCAKSIDPSFETKDLANKLFCLQLAKWVTRKSYSNKVYFFTTFDKDPFHYAYKSTATDKDSIRRKSTIGIAIEAEEHVPEPVRDEAIAARKA